MMVDVTELAKSFGAQSFSFSNAASSPKGQQWPNDGSQPSPQAAYSRDFLVNYLMHYCRISQQLKRQGTIPVLQAVLEVDPENAEAYYLLARQYELNDDIEEALLCFEKAAGMRPDKANYMLAGARAACYLGQRHKGLGMIQSVLEAHPEMAEAYQERALIYEADENWLRALRDYEMCSRLRPDVVHYWVSEARMNRLVGQNQNALRCARNALRLDPGNVDAQEELKLIPFPEKITGFLRNDSKRDE